MRRSPVALALLLAAATVLTVLLIRAGAREPALALLTLIAASVILVAVWVVPLWQASRWPTSLVAKERIELEDKARNTVVSLIGAVGLVATAAITLYQISGTRATAERTLQLTEEAQSAERFSRAVELLGATAGNSPAVEVRLGGIATLEEYALSHGPQELGRVARILSGYIRSATMSADPVALPELETAPCQAGAVPVRADIEAALRSLKVLFPIRGRFTQEPAEWERSAEPPRFDLAGADLSGADLELLDLRGADLSGARLYAAQVGATLMDEANLRNVDARFLCAVNFSANGALFGSFGWAPDEASLRAGAVDLRGAKLIDGDLRDARFEYVDARGALLRGLDVEGAIFLGGKFADATIEDLHGLDEPFPCGGLFDLPCGVAPAPEQ
jgi:hypothetical protein